MRPLPPAWSVAATRSGGCEPAKAKRHFQRAAKAGLTPFDDVAELLRHADIVLSICPPHGALEVARALAGFRGIVVDANAISPEGAVQIGHTVTSGGARYVDGGIIGPPPVTAGTTRLYLAGDDGEVSSLFAGSPLASVNLTGAPRATSALKMTYAAWTKTTAALLVSIRRYRFRLRCRRRPGKRMGDEPTPPCSGMAARPPAERRKGVAVVL